MRKVFIVQPINLAVLLGPPALLVGAYLYTDEKVFEVYEKEISTPIGLSEKDLDYMKSNPGCNLYKIPGAFSFFSATGIGNDDEILKKVDEMIDKR